MILSWLALHKICLPDIFPDMFLAEESPLMNFKSGMLSQIFGCELLCGMERFIPCALTKGQTDTVHVTLLLLSVVCKCKSGFVWLFGLHNVFQCFR